MLKSAKTLNLFQRLIWRVVMNKKVVCLGVGMCWKDCGINFQFMPTLVKKVEKYGVVMGCSGSN